MKYKTKSAIERDIPSKIYWCLYYLENTTTKNNSPLWETLDGIYDYLENNIKHKRSVTFSNVLRLVQENLIKQKWIGKRRLLSINKEKLIELYENKLIERLRRRLKEYKRHLERAKRSYKDVPEALNLSLKAIITETKTIDRIKIPRVLASGICSYFEKEIELPQNCLVMGTIEEELDKLVDLTFATNFKEEKLAPELRDFQSRINRIFRLEQIKFIDALRENAQKYIQKHKIQ